MADAYDLGPTTEARFAKAFACGATITAKAAADLLGLDVKTLAALSERKLIRWVLRGSLPAYTERDLRAYLVEGPDVECVPAAEPKPRAAPVSSGKVVPFSQRKAPARRLR